MPTAHARRPLWLRCLSFPVRLCLALWAEFELRGRAVVELILRPRYQIRGACHHNGTCCRHLLIADDVTKAWAPLRAVANFWLCRIYPFHPTANAVELPDGRFAQVYSCSNLTAELHCREHFLRPMLCRQYPRPRYFTPPALHHGCGYVVVDRRSGQVIPTPAAHSAVVDPASLRERWRPR